MNQPPRIFSVAPGTGQKSLLMDLNPQFKDLAFARVEEISFTPASYHEVKAGLYWPLDYVEGKKYPLVVQTHGWQSDKFWIDGPWTTGYAAQALAGKGFFVLQLTDPEDVLGTPREVPSAMATYEGAIDILDRKGLIDRDRIGISGYSQSGRYVVYALTHPEVRFAAAVVSDFQDFDYFQYTLRSNSEQLDPPLFARANGAPPFGDGLLKWFNESPGFLMDKIETPLRVQALDPDSLLYQWQWYSGLATLSKPVEMIYLPDGVHTLEKPWDRMISQQGNVDWFCFWLKGEEDPNPDKTEQYKHWGALRTLNTKGVSAGAPQLAVLPPQATKAPN